MDTDGRRGDSLWRATAPAWSAPRVDDHGEVQVLVVGAGILGLTTALLAARRGLSTLVLEADDVGAGTSGSTTGKFSAVNGLRYANLRRRFGRDGAAAYAAAARNGVERTRGIIEDAGIDCGVELVPSHLAVTTDALVRDLELEATAAAETGLHPIRGWDGHPLDVPVRGVLTFRDQLQLHPMAYLQGLAEAMTAAGGILHERRRALGLSRHRGRWSVATSTDAVVADHVVVATRLPALGDRRLTFARTVPVGAAVVAGKVGRLPHGSALLVGDRTWSLRSSRWPEGQQHLIAVGPDAPSPAGERTSVAVEEWVRTHFPGIEVSHRWFAQDQQPLDGRPFIGRLRDGSVWTATGFGKWGLALGTDAAARIVAGIVGEPYPASGFFEPTRLQLGSALPRLLGANLAVARRWIGGRVRAPTAHDGAELELGQGRVRRIGRHLVAEAKDADGVVHRLDARCTHLGCPVSWNATAGTWDCRCHGARFAVDGSVLEAPATERLRPIEGEV